MLIGVDTTDPSYNTGGLTGGSATTTLSTTNLPSHTHALGTSASASGSGTGTISGTTGLTNLAHTHLLSSIDSNAFDNYVGGGAPGKQEFIRSYGTSPSTDVDATSSQASVDMNHNHSISGTCSVSVTSIDISGNTNSTGDGTPFSTISPWISVYMWQRTA
jgi:microcystin-dependent protein